MDAIFSEFAAADASEQGYALAATISPEPPKHDPARLYNFYRSTNAHSLQTDLRYRLQYNPSLQLDKQEASAWIEVFAAFHKFTGVLLGAEEAQNSGREVEAKWGDVYESWKDVVTALLKGYQSGAFYAWTIPCLYVAGKYTRVFAIKADDNAAASGVRRPGFVIARRGGAAPAAFERTRRAIGGARAGDVGLVVHFPDLRRREMAFG